VPVVHDTGASTFSSNDQRVTVFVDVDNRQVVDGEALGRAGQRVRATIALLVGLPLAVGAAALLIRRRRGGPPAPPAPPAPPVAPPPTPPPVPGPGGTWVWYPPGTSPPGVPPPEAPDPEPPA
jgi:hypothetical protein